MLTAVQAQQAGEKPLVWKPLKVDKSFFPRDLGMLDSERDEYASNLAGLAVLQLRSQKNSAASIEQARRMLALALHLSPRNKRALVTNFQLAKGIIPEQADVDYRPQSFSKLLQKRAQLLVKQEGKGNVELGGYLLHLAAELDPKSEDAIYLSELHRLNHGECDWSLLTQPAGEVRP